MLKSHWWFILLFITAGPGKWGLLLRSFQLGWPNWPHALEPSELGGNGMDSRTFKKQGVWVTACDKGRICGAGASTVSTGDRGVRHGPQMPWGKVPEGLNIKAWSSPSSPSVPAVCFLSTSSSAKRMKRILRIFFKQTNQIWNHRARPNLNSTTYLLAALDHVT